MKMYNSKVTFRKSDNFTYHVKVSDRNERNLNTFSSNSHSVRN